MEAKFAITDSETAFKAVALNGMAFQFVSHHLRTEALALLAVGNNAHALKHVPAQFRTEAVLLKAMESDVHVLPHIPEPAWSEALALCVIEKHALDLASVPAEFRTESVVRRAVQRNGMAFEQVPEHLLSQTLVDAAALSCEKALQYAPLEFHSEEAALRAGIRYRFDYEQCLRDAFPDDPTFTTTCIVPSAWLKMALPTFGGSVVYTDKTDKSDLSGLVFEFAEMETDDLARTVSLQIYTLEDLPVQGRLVEPEAYFAHPVKIHCRDFVVADNDWCIQIVLVNHFLGPLHAVSSWGNCFFDFFDLCQVLKGSSEFIFEFGIGRMPVEIVPDILERAACSDAGDVFLMFYCNQDLFRLAYLDEIMGSVQAIFETSTVIFGNAAVKQDRMLISALVGYKPADTNLAC